MVDAQDNAGNTDSSAVEDIAEEACHCQGHSREDALLLGAYGRLRGTLALLLLGPRHDVVDAEKEHGSLAKRKIIS